MAEWPTVEGIRAVLGVDGAQHDPALTSALAAARDVILAKLGVRNDDLDDYEPNEAVAQAVLLTAVQVMKGPEAPFGVAGVTDLGAYYVAANNPNIERLLIGSRVSFGVA